MHAWTHANARATAGGIYRDCFIEATSLVHIDENGLFAASDTDPANNRSVAHPITHVINTNSKHVKNVHVTFAIYAPDGSLAAPVATSATGTIAAGTTFEFDATDAGIAVASPSLWSIQSPALYALVAAVFVDGKQVDTLEVVFGFRSATFSADSGFALNGNPVVLRGFSNHNDMVSTVPGRCYDSVPLYRGGGSVAGLWCSHVVPYALTIRTFFWFVCLLHVLHLQAGVGAAVPQRLNLFRAQMLRGVGANIWRMSHNPGDPATFNLLDRLGIM